MDSSILFLLNLFNPNNNSFLRFKINPSKLPLDNQFLIKDTSQFHIKDSRMFYTNSNSNFLIKHIKDSQVLLINITKILLLLLTISLNLMDSLDNSNKILYEEQ